MIDYANSPSKAYVWVNQLYLSDKQKGIQAAHCIGDMSQIEKSRDMFNRWSDVDKTLIIFDGTNSGTIRRINSILSYITEALSVLGLECPHALFCESEEALDGAATACSIILPDELRKFGSFGTVKTPTTKEYYDDIMLNQKVIGAFSLSMMCDWLDGQRLA